MKSREELEQEIVELTEELQWASDQLDNQADRIAALEQYIYDMTAKILDILGRGY